MVTGRDTGTCPASGPRLGLAPDLPLLRDGFERVRRRRGTPRRNGGLCSGYPKTYPVPVKRLRRPLSLLLCLSFLWAQMAVAAFACHAPEAMHAATAAAAPCHGEAAAAPADPRCRPHCDPQPPLPDTAKLPVFAPLGGSPHAGELVVRLGPGGDRAQAVVEVAPHASPPLIDLYAHRLI